jgi:hypothetical protein
MDFVICPNCKGRPSDHWPGGVCTVCGGLGKTTPERAAEVLENARKEVAAMREP